MKRQTLALLSFMLAPTMALAENQVSTANTAFIQYNSNVKNMPIIGQANMVSTIGANVATSGNGNTANVANIKKEMALSFDANFRKVYTGDATKMVVVMDRYASSKVDKSLAVTSDSELTNEKICGTITVTARNMNEDSVDFSSVRYDVLRVLDKLPIKCKALTTMQDICATTGVVSFNESEGASAGTGIGIIDGLAGSLGLAKGNGKTTTKIVNSISITFYLVKL